MGAGRVAGKVVIVTGAAGGQGAAEVAWLVREGRPVVNITGDGAFGFTLPELDTARRLGLPVVTVIHDNAA